MDIGAPEFLIAVVIILLLFGPGQVTKLSRALGASMREFRQAQAEASADVADGASTDRTPVDTATERDGSVRSPDGGSHAGD